MASSASKQSRKAKQKARDDTEALLAAAEAGSGNKRDDAAAAAFFLAAGSGGLIPAASPANPLASAGAESGRTATLVTLFLAALVTARGDESWLYDIVRPEFSEDEVDDAEIREQAAIEREREADFIRNMRKRLERDLPQALLQPDPVAAVDVILEREQRYMDQHDDAAAARVEAAVKRRLVKRLSSEGAYWILSPYVKKHTPDCEAMAAVGWWPWEVLDNLNPPVHTGCRCDLLTRDEAIGMGYMEAGELPDKAEAIQRAKAIVDLYDLGEAEWRWLPPLDETELMELQWNRRYPKGTIWGGRFMPKRGGFAPRISIQEILRRLMGADAPPIASRGGQRTIAAPDLDDMSTPTRAADAGDLTGRISGASVSPDLDQIVDGLKAKLTEATGINGGVMDEVGKVGIDPNISGGRRAPDGPGKSRIVIGKDTADTLERLSAKQARGETLTTGEAAQLYEARRVVTHELIHAASAITLDDYRSHEGFATEEALTEELAHVIMTDAFITEGNFDVMRLIEQDPDNDVLKGMYRLQRTGLVEVLDRANVPERERRALLEKLSFGMSTTDERIAELARRLADAEGISEEQAAEIVRNKMAAAGATAGPGRDQLVTAPIGRGVLAPRLVDIQFPDAGFDRNDVVKVTGRGDRDYNGRVIDFQMLDDGRVQPILEVPIKDANGGIMDYEIRIPDPDDIQKVASATKKSLKGRKVTGPVKVGDRIRIKRNNGDLQVGTLDRIASTGSGPDGGFAIDVTDGMGRRIRVRSTELLDVQRANERTRSRRRARPKPKVPGGARRTKAVQVSGPRGYDPRRYQDPRRALLTKMSAMPPGDQLQLADGSVVTRGTKGNVSIERPDGSQKVYPSPARLANAETEGIGRRVGMKSGRFTPAVDGDPAQRGTIAFKAKQDEALDKVEMATPTAMPSAEEHAFDLGNALMQWQDEPNSVEGPELDALQRELAVSSPGAGPFFRGQPGDRPDPIRSGRFRGWSKDLKTAIAFALEGPVVRESDGNSRRYSGVAEAIGELAPGEALTITLYEAKSAKYGIDINQKHEDISDDHETGRVERAQSTIRDEWSNPAYRALAGPEKLEQMVDRLLNDPQAEGSLRPLENEFENEMEVILDNESVDGYRGVEVVLAIGGEDNGEITETTVEAKVSRALETGETFTPPGKPVEPEEDLEWALDDQAIDDAIAQGVSDADFDMDDEARDIMASLGLTPGGSDSRELSDREEQLLEMATPSMLDRIKDGEGPVEDLTRRALNAIGIDPYDVDWDKLADHATEHELDPVSRFSVGGKGLSPCANFRLIDFAVHVLLPEMLAEKYPNAAEKLRQTSPRWGWRTGRLPTGAGRPVSMATPTRPTRLEIHRQAQDAALDRAVEMATPTRAQTEADLRNLGEELLVWVRDPDAMRGSAIPLAVENAEEKQGPFYRGQPADAAPPHQSGRLRGWSTDLETAIGFADVGGYELRTKDGTRRKASERERSGAQLGDGDIVVASIYVADSAVGIDVTEELEGLNETVGYRDPAAVEAAITTERKLATETFVDMASGQVGEVAVSSTAIRRVMKRVLGEEFGVNFEADDIRAKPADMPGRDTELGRALWSLQENARFDALKRVEEELKPPADQLTIEGIEAPPEPPLQAEYRARLNDAEEQALNWMLDDPADSPYWSNPYESEAEHILDNERLNNYRRIDIVIKTGGEDDPTSADVRLEEAVLNPDSKYRLGERRYDGSGEEVADASLTAARDQALDHAMATPTADFEPGPEFDQHLREVIKMWCNWPDDVRQNEEAMRILQHAIDTAPETEGPFFRGQPPNLTDPDQGARGWSDNVNIAIDFAINEGLGRRGPDGEIRPADRLTSDLVESLEPGEELVATLFVADRANGLDLPEIMQEVGPYDPEGNWIWAREGEHILKPDTLQNYSRVEVVLARAGEKLPTAGDESAEAVDAEQEILRKRVLDAIEADRSGKPAAAMPPAKDAALDRLEQMATPTYDPASNPDHRRNLASALDDWQSDPQMALDNPEQADALSWEIRNGEKFDRPLFRGQAASMPPPTAGRYRGWSKSERIALEYAGWEIRRADGSTYTGPATVGNIIRSPGATQIPDPATLESVTDPKGKLDEPGDELVVTIHTARNATGLDVVKKLSELDLTVSFMEEQEVIVDNEQAQYERLDVVLARLGDPDRTGALDRVRDAIANPDSPYRAKPPAAERVAERMGRELPAMATPTKGPNHDEDLANFIDTWIRDWGGTDGEYTAEQEEAFAWEIANSPVVEAPDNGYFVRGTSEGGTSGPRSYSTDPTIAAQFAVAQSSELANILPDGRVALDYPEDAGDTVTFTFQIATKGRGFRVADKWEPIDEFTDAPGVLDDEQEWLLDADDTAEVVEVTYPSNAIPRVEQIGKDAVAVYRGERPSMATPTFDLFGWTQKNKPERVEPLKRSMLEMPPAPVQGIPRYNVELTDVEAAGGSNGARIAVDKDGNSWLLKPYRGNADRVASELLANSIYRELGIRVSNAGIVEHDHPEYGKQLAVAYPLIKGEIRQWSQPNEELGDGFVADALLANWDVIGLTQDNVLWNSGRPIRLDQGGALAFRAQGARKDYGPVPSELWTMQSERGQANGTMKITEDGMLAGARDAALRLPPERVDELVDQAPFEDEAMREQVRQSLKDRVAWLERFANGDESLPEPLEGDDARAYFDERDELLITAPEEDDSVRDYMGQMRGAIEMHLQSGAPKEATTPEVRRAIANIDMLLAIDETKIDEDVIAYAPLPDIDNPEGLAGKWVREKSYLPLDLDYRPGPGETAIRVKIPAGANALRTSSLGVGGPGELLLPRNTSLKVQAVAQEDGSVILRAVAKPR
jgi:hypothetical protein